MFEAALEGKGQLHRVSKHVAEKEIWGADEPEDLPDMYQNSRL